MEILPHLKALGFLFSGFFFGAMKFQYICKTSSYPYSWSYEKANLKNFKESDNIPPKIRFKGLPISQNS